MAIGMRASLVLSGCLALIAAAGCGGSSDGKLPIAGTITVKGEPVEEGTIMFASRPPAQSAFTGSLIKEGKFLIPAQQGLLPGAYIVRITAPEPGTVAAEPLPGVSGPPAKDKIPPQFNAQSQLEFVVKPDTVNEFHFDVP